MHTFTHRLAYSFMGQKKNDFQVAMASACATADILMKSFKGFSKITWFGHKLDILNIFIIIWWL